MLDLIVAHDDETSGFRYPRGVTTRSSVKSSELVTRTASIAAEVAAKHAGDVDANSRFPHETFAALKHARLLSAAVPRSHGGHGAGMLELGHQCAALAQGCGSSAMVLAMHHIQVACIARHGRGTPYFDAYLRDKLAGRAGSDRVDHVGERHVRRHAQLESARSRSTAIT